VWVARVEWRLVQPSISFNCAAFATPPSYVIVAVTRPFIPHFIDWLFAHTCALCNTHTTRGAQGGAFEDKEVRQDAARSGG